MCSGISSRSSTRRRPSLRPGSLSSRLSRETAPVCPGKIRSNPAIGMVAGAQLAAGTRVADRNPRRRLQTGRQDGMSFVVKDAGIIAQKTQHPAFPWGRFIAPSIPG